ncbi:hypothetical protein [Clostridium sp.]|uniref:hypothetical protein n=1 Tax=Clostridium sp. TaxID=1506 RepID=UPI00261B4A8B|nr:hypothetical protein [Clostridium sp.]
MGLGKSTNASKNAKSWADCVGHSKLGEVPIHVRINALERESLPRDALEKAIEERLEK